jgi:putative glutamine amidotransferase
VWLNAASSGRWRPRQLLKILNVFTRKPLIGIPADRRLLGHHYFHCVGEKYIAAIADGAHATPVLLPALGEALDLKELLADFDGILLTGSPSNVQPHHYRGPASDAGTLHDPQRDATTLPVIPHIVQAGLPLLAICRGFQEMNVAFGGTLWQKLHEVQGHLMHKENVEAPLDEQYGPAHPVMLTPGGQLHTLAGVERLEVNSLHSQGVQALGASLEVEARAPDGVIEAFRVRNAPSFALAVQWHPEWKFQMNAFSRALFKAFGDAARKRAASRRGGASLASHQSLVTSH